MWNKHRQNNTEAAIKQNNTHNGKELPRGFPSQSQITKPNTNNHSKSPEANYQDSPSLSCFHRTEVSRLRGNVPAGPKEPPRCHQCQRLPEWSLLNSYRAPRCCGWQRNLFSPGLHPLRPRFKICSQQRLLVSEQSSRRKRCLLVQFRLWRWGHWEGGRSRSPSFAQGARPAANLNKIFLVWPKMLEEAGSNPSRAGMRAVAAAAAAASGTVAAGVGGGGGRCSSLVVAPNLQASFGRTPGTPVSDQVTKLTNLESPGGLREETAECCASRSASAN